MSHAGPTGRVVLVVMRLADMHRAHPLQDNSRRCLRCQAQVGIYPSGQRVLTAYPTLEITCNVCHEQEGAAVLVLAPGAELEPLESHPVRAAT